RVAIQPFTGGARSSAEMQVIGETPVTGYRMPRVDHRVVITLEGFESAERIASTALSRAAGGRSFMRGTAFVPGRVAGLLGTEAEAALFRAREVVFDVALVPDDRRPDMVFVPGGEYELVSPDAPVGLVTTLDDFFMDRFEVSNEAFREFVLQGGYGNSELWTGTTDAARAPLVDRTGLPGPRAWSSQTMPTGLERHPVTGVTWHEAAAYCAFVGKRLPTIFEWEKTAREGKAARQGVLMPWGLMASSGASASRANFNSNGTVPIDSFPFGLSPYGVHAAAGNVKEWLANRMGAGYTVTGGSWEDPAYLYTEYGSQPGTFASEALGFRCATTAREGDGDQGGGTSNWTSGLRSTPLSIEQRSSRCWRTIAMTPSPQILGWTTRRRLTGGCGNASGSMALGVTRCSCTFTCPSRRSPRIRRLSMFPDRACSVAKR
ncbi:MAG: SUMF1/EgtB/PvdO family nonheme iron enzyme, partial [Gemmatimonadetes bacterium]|nr:SUMF1/EgtB/PvdO family nonheme iron enzyme [Gemmatimonadota bacterium]